MICYLNNSGCTDPDFVDFKGRLGERLKSLCSNKSAPEQNIACFGLNSCNLSIYYQCVRDADDESMPVEEFKKSVDDWRRVVLGLDRENAAVLEVYQTFCKIAGFINYPPKAIEQHFVCPLCILTDAYTDIGWTDYVCPRPAGDTPSSVSKRGVDESIPTGACEHLISVRTTKYNKLFKNVDHVTG